MANNYAYLIKVDANANNNKYYEIFENDDKSIDVKYGRIGGHEMTKHYDKYQKDFYLLKNEKERKGYEDRTALHSTKEINKETKDILSYKPIEDKEINEVFNLFISSSAQFIKDNYTVTAEKITEKMIKEAERDLNKLNIIASSNSSTKMYDFNRTLQELFTDIPRKMSRVSDNLAKKESDFEKIIQNEKDMIDNVRGIVMKSKTNDTEKNNNMTVLEAFGLKVRKIDYDEEDKIINSLGYDYNGTKVENRYLRAFAIENTKTQKAFEQYIEINGIKKDQIIQSFHGSKVENWASILKQGLSLNPNAVVTGKMFGNGLYFAPECRKSLNYMDTKGSRWNNGKRETGYCAIFEVALGNPYKPNRILGRYFNKDNLPTGTHSVVAEKTNRNLNLKNDEYIVYDQSACTVKYIMEMTHPNVREKIFNLERNSLRNQLRKGFMEIRKTEKGIEGTLDCSVLPIGIKAILEDTLKSDVTKINIKSEKPYTTSQITFYDKNDNVNLTNDKLTIDDNEFLTREMKKAFAVSEDKWLELVENKAYKVGEIIAKNNGYNTKQKELFGIKEGIILQQCNCQGAYGGGLSGAISLQYPEVYTAFKKFNQMYPTPEIQLGKHQIIDLKNNESFLAVANLYTQEKYGNAYKTNIKYTDTEKLVANIKEIAETYSNVPIYVPHSVDNKGRHSGIGCGLAGEKWENLYKLLKDLKKPNLYMLDTYTGEIEKMNSDIEFKKGSIKNKKKEEREVV